MLSAVMQFRNRNEAAHERLAVLEHDGRKRFVGRSSSNELDDIKSRLSDGCKHVSANLQNQDEFFGSRFNNAKRVHRSRTSSRDAARELLVVLELHEASQAANRAQTSALRLLRISLD